MNNFELNRKIKELFDMKITEWESVPTRMKELESIRDKVQNIPKEPEYFNFKRMMKALNHRARIQILIAIKKGALCPCELEYITNLSQATISHHLALLEDAGLILKNREGKWMLLKLKDNPIFEYFELLPT